MKRIFGFGPVSSSGEQSESSTRMRRNDEENNGVDDTTGDWFFPEQQEHSHDTPSKDVVADIDRTMASAMNSLSLQERELAMFSLHGVRDIPSEEPQMVEHCLQEMETAMQSLTGRLRLEKSAYLRAIQKNSEYQTDSFRLMFLRAEQFQPQEAAKRIIRFFDLKESLWGTDLLHQEVTLNDFTADDLTGLSFCMVLPVRDRAGRAVVVVNPFKSAPADARVRALFYTIMKAARDPDVQKHGLVFIVVLPNRKKTLEDMKVSRSFPSLFPSLPLKICAFHTCSPKSSPLLRLAQIGLSLLPSINIPLARCHTGSWTETQYDLLTYGIPVSALPMDESTGEFQPHLQQEWQESIRQQELAASSSPSTYQQSPLVSDGSSSLDTAVASFTTPRSQDVLFGKHRMIFSHPGNLRYLALISDTMDEFEKASREERKEIIARVIDTIHKNDGRFLKLDPVSRAWTVVKDVELCKDKVSNAYRDKRKALLRAKAREEKKNALLTAPPVDE